MTNIESNVLPRYDVIVAGARCAGASTAMLLARHGARVLLVDPARRGSDTLSTHALMRAGVLQLHRWGLLDRIRAAGTPPVRATSFHYGDDEVVIPIKPRDGVDALYAPRRTILDAILVDAAEDAGVDIVMGHALTGLLRDESDRVNGAVIAAHDQRGIAVQADLVVGADGLRSRVARLASAEVVHHAAHATASIYGYQQGVDLEGFHWYYRPGGAVGTIPTNGGDTCVFASLPPGRFEGERRDGLAALYHRVLTEVSPELADHVKAGWSSGKLRAFPGIRGFLRQAAGPGWALVGDAAYFKDPLTAHGITDALRDAELLARAVATGTDEALHSYHTERDHMVRGLMDVTDRIASFEWDLDAARRDHLALSKEMAAEVEVILALDRMPAPVWT